MALNRLTGGIEGQRHYSFNMLSKLKQDFANLPYQTFRDYYENLEDYAKLAAKVNRRVKRLMIQCESLYQKPQIFPPTESRDTFFENLAPFLEKAGVILEVIEKLAPLAQEHRELIKRGHTAYMRRTRPTFVWGIKPWSQFLRPGAPGASFAFASNLPQQQFSLQVLPRGGICIWSTWLADAESELEKEELNRTGYLSDHEDLWPDEYYCTQGYDGLYRKLSREADQEESRIKHVGYDDEEPYYFGPRSLEQYNQMLSIADGEHHHEFETADLDQFEYYEITTYIPSKGTHKVREPRRIFPKLLYTKFELTEISYPELNRIVGRKASHEEVYGSVLRRQEFTTRAPEPELELVDNNKRQTRNRFPKRARILSRSYAKQALAFYHRYIKDAPNYNQRGGAIPFGRILSRRVSLKVSKVERIMELKAFDDVWWTLLHHMEFLEGVNRNDLDKILGDIGDHVLAELDLGGLEALL
ncbi:hypothetical protein EJ05DRAFT_385461 [Pseudovirgaria hyperparasitica]|uniref:Uncharacterized protein n=1 Tax=Pseudovirgaria hyperparasitica TaxID=470096 RepID=A0A6A6W6V4_9PEZI|nr:uncharacterized protein EJ05DRAFT_385461 [Pseudovirgaria hyperparasitica]KAF2757297.1 hypothetical protein EJ05DRAFT_385461 [Pseudovirgaria hyperparasitica]